MKQRWRKHRSAKIGNITTNNNPLAADPTRTAGLRRQFTNELRRHFDQLHVFSVNYVINDDPGHPGRPGERGGSQPGHGGAVGGVGSVGGVSGARVGAAVHVEAQKIAATGEARIEKSSIHEGDAHTAKGATSAVQSATHSEAKKGSTGSSTTDESKGEVKKAGIFGFGGRKEKVSPIEHVTDTAGLERRLANSPEVRANKARLDKRNEAAYKDIARREGVADAREAIRDKAQKLADSMDQYVRVPQTIIPKLLESGRFKSTFETNTGSGLRDKNKRIDAEKVGMGVPEHIQDKYRPISGYLSEPGYKNAADEYANIYGGAIAKLKRSVRDRSMATFGDSLSVTGGNHEGVASPLNKIEHYSVVPEHIQNAGLKMLDNAHEYHKVAKMPFVETLTHGGLGLHDIEEIAFPHDRPPSAATIEALSRHGIKVRSYQRSPHYATINVFTINDVWLINAARRYTSADGDYTIFVTRNGDNGLTYGRLRHNPSRMLSYFELPVNSFMHHMAMTTWHPEGDDGQDDESDKDNKDGKDARDNEEDQTTNNYTVGDTDFNLPNGVAALPPDDHGYQPTLAIDVDGTLNDTPAQPGGQPRNLVDLTPRAEVILAAQLAHAAGWRIIIWTVRDDYANIANWLNQHRIPFDFINYNPDQPTTSPKVAADYYIDDRNLTPEQFVNDLTQLTLTNAAVHQPVSKDAGYQKLAQFGHQAMPEFVEMLDRTGFPIYHYDDFHPDQHLATPGGIIILAPLKSPERAKEKVNEDYDGDWSKLTDMLRASIAVDSLSALHNAVTKVGGKVVRVKDRFAKPLPNGYRDYHVNYQLPSGLIAEIQYHLKPILAAREKEKLPYGVIRSVKGAMKAEGRSKMTPSEAKVVGKAHEVSKQLMTGAWKLAQQQRGDGFNSLTGNFNPDEARDEQGRWTTSGQPTGSTSQLAGTTSTPGLPRSGGVRGSAGVMESSRATTPVSAAPLIGLPTTATIPNVGVVTVGPSVHIRQVAADYMREHGLPYNPPRVYVKVDKERAKRIAAEYDKMPHAPNDPLVKASYEQMANEVVAQYEAAIKNGLKVDYIDYAKQGDPYAASPRLAIQDIQNNNHMWVFPTSAGFGSNDDVNVANNPLLKDSGYTISGQKATINDLFRVVHDYFGHAKEGNGMRATGEENAWRSHVAMFSPLARKAMTSETRGQNSWVNFGPYGEFNQHASGATTHYADQKTGLLPDWVVVEGAEDPPLTNFNPDQPRVPAGSAQGGRWVADSDKTDGKTGAKTDAIAISFISPNIKSNADLDYAVQALQSRRQQLYHRIAQEVNHATGLSGAETDVIGAWADGAENSTMLQTHPGDDYQAVKVNAAMKGYLAEQKQVLTFQEQKDGPHALYEMEVSGDLQQVHRNLLNSGIAFHTLIPQKGGQSVKIMAVDTDGSLQEPLSNFAVRNHTHVSRKLGQADFLGTNKQDGTDAEQRADAQAIYEKIIAGDHRFTAVWPSLRDRWRERLHSVANAANVAKSRYRRQQPRGGLINFAVGIVNACLDPELWSKYLGAAYLKGVRRSFDDGQKRQRSQVTTNEQAFAYQGAREQFVANVARHHARTGLQRLWATYRHHASAIGNQLLTRLLGSNSVQRQHFINNSYQQLAALARLAMVNAFTDGQLTSLDQQGVSNVQRVADPNCRCQHGQTLTVHQARSLSPSHAACRCAWVPTANQELAQPHHSPLTVFSNLLSNYNPNQPRIPIGQPGGGQWSKGSQGAPPTHGAPAEVAKRVQAGEMFPRWQGTSTDQRDSWDKIASPLPPGERRSEWTSQGDNHPVGSHRVPPSGHPLGLPDSITVTPESQQPPVVLPDPNDVQANKLFYGKQTNRETLGGGVNGSYKITLDNGLEGVWKPEQEEDEELARMIGGSLYKREAAAYEVAKLTAMDDLVPPTVVRTINGEIGSLMQWVPDADEARKADMEGMEVYDGNIHRRWVAAFDYLIGNTDRHAGNWMVDDHEGLHLIDHGLSFPSYRDNVHSKFFDKVRLDTIPKEITAWGRVWPEMEKKLHDLGIEQSAIDSTHERLLSLVNLAGNGSFGSLPVAFGSRYRYHSFQ